ncbi:RNA polymerase sigma factor [Ulvibacterium sp.]|uniref:RNA polymerase sigma factor n=1 Tax=Ulvibacterium sp. TaxID=2665914 RepID=UPI003BAA2EFC
MKRIPKETIPREKLEELLVSNCKLRKKGSQELLYKHFYGYAFKISRLNTYSREEAVDVLNDSFIKVFGSIGKFQEGKSFKPWLKRIIVNTSVDNFRSKKEKFLSLEPVTMGNTRIDAEAISLLNVADILAALDRLPRLHRLVFTLFEIQGYTHGEIAEMLDIGESSSRTFLARAKKKLRVVLQNQVKSAT